MKKKLIMPLVLLVLATLACTISYEGINFGDDPEVSLLEDQTATAASAQTTTPAKAATTPEPEYQPPSSQASSAEAFNNGENEYSVTATDFDCICQVDGNVMVEFNIMDGKLEQTMSGGTPQVYEKIGENTYKRTFMGYYISTNGSGAQATETVVEEERHLVIILNDDGYVLEHYQGAASSPCCYHTFTLEGAFGTVK